MLRSIALVMALYSSQVSAQDSWSGQDKRLHLSISFAAGVGCAQIFQNDFGPAFTCAMLPGVVKELIDSQEEGNKFSGKDLVADAIGAALGVKSGHWLLMRYRGQTIVAYRTQF